MKRTITLHHLTLASTFAVLASGCLLKLDGLDAGVDDDESGDESSPLEADECLIGTEIDAVGVEQSSMDPGCEVTCSEGWGHPGEQLEIAWTEGEDDYPVDGVDAQPLALGLLASGRIVVARHVPGAIVLTHLEPDGLNIGGYDVEGIGSHVFGADIASNVLYVTHGELDGTVLLTAVDIDSQQPLWQREFAGTWAHPVVRGGGKIAFALGNDDEQAPNGTLMVMDLDGNQLWTAPVESQGGFGVAFSPSNARIAVAGDVTRVYAADDGALLDEFVHGALPILYAQAAAFSDEDRVVTVGMAVEYERFEGWLASDSLAGGAAWEQTYNRADSWCPDADDDQWSAATAELFGEVVRLADGSLMVAGVEAYEYGPDPVVHGAQPWVVRFSTDGEFLGSDRGLWDGGALDVVAGPDGSAFVLSTVNDGDGMPEGFRVRKYVL